MAERGKSAGRTKRSTRQTPAELSAGRANLAKGRAAREEKRRQGREQGRPTASERWGMLLSGQITVKDLDDEELRAMAVRGKDGVINKRRNMIPSHIAQAMRQEAIQRANDMVRAAAPAAMKRLLEIAADPDTKDSDAIKALSIVLERSLGKTPQEIKVDGISGFDALSQAAKVVVEREFPNNVEESSK